MYDSGSRMSQKSTTDVSAIAPSHTAPGGRARGWRRMLRRLGWRAGAAASAGAAVVVAGANDTDHALPRATRTICYALVTGLDYKRSANLPKDSPERAAAYRSTHQRSAQRLLRLCQLHVGLLDVHVARILHILGQASSLHALLL